MSTSTGTNVIPPRLQQYIPDASYLVLSPSLWKSATNSRRFVFYSTFVFVVIHSRLFYYRHLYTKYIVHFSSGMLLLAKNSLFIDMFPVLADLSHWKVWALWPAFHKIVYKKRKLNFGKAMQRSSKTLQSPINDLISVTVAGSCRSQLASVILFVASGYRDIIKLSR